MLCDDLEGWDGEGGSDVQEGGDTCICITDSLYCTAETNTALESSYTPIKKKKKSVISVLQVFPPLCLQKLPAG